MFDRNDQLDRPPGPSGTELARVLWQIQSRPLEGFQSVSRNYGDVAYMSLGSLEVYLLARPEHVKHVLQDRHRNYRKAKTYEVLRPLLGNGLLLSEGDYWLRQRRLVAPMFHRDRIATFVDAMVEGAENMLDRWAVVAEEDGVLDVADEMHRVTLEIVGRVLFSRDITGEAAEIGDALKILLDDANRRVVNPICPPLAIPTPHNRKVRRAMSALEEIVYDMIADRRGREDDVEDLLSMLLLAEDEETGDRMTDEQVRDEVMTFILAGHETTANALGWALYLLSKNPEIRRRAAAEVREQSGDRPTLDQTRELTYVEQVFDETLRMYPPAWTVERTPHEDDEIDGWTIPAGSVVVTAPYIIHHNPDVWPNPEGFDPERFVPEAKKEHHRYAHFPFGGGPRLCVGADFAVLEAKIVLSMILSRFELDLEPTANVETNATVTLGFGDEGLPMIPVASA